MIISVRPSSPGCKAQYTFARSSDDKQTDKLAQSLTILASTLSPITVLNNFNKSGLSACNFWYKKYAVFTFSLLHTMHF